MVPLAGHPIDDGDFVGPRLVEDARGAARSAPERPQHNVDGSSRTATASTDQRCRGRREGQPGAGRAGQDIGGSERLEFEDRAERSGAVAQPADVRVQFPRFDRGDQPDRSRVEHAQRGLEHGHRPQMHVVGQHEHGTRAVRDGQPHTHREVQSSELFVHGVQQCRASAAGGADGHGAQRMARVRAIDDARHPRRGARRGRGRVRTVTDRGDRCRRGHRTVQG